MIGSLVLEVIPFRSFKEKIRITKKYHGNYDIEVYENYVLISRRGKNVN